MQRRSFSVKFCQFRCDRPAANRLFYAENARQLKDFFKFVTMSVSIRSQLPTPNSIPQAGTIEIQPATIETRQAKSKGAAQNLPNDDEGYW